MVPKQRALVEKGKLSSTKKTDMANIPLTFMLPPWEGWSYRGAAPTVRQGRALAPQGAQ